MVDDVGFIEGAGLTREGHGSEDRVGTVDVNRCSGVGKLNTDVVEIVSKNKKQKKKEKK